MKNKRKVIVVAFIVVVGFVFLLVYDNELMKISLRKRKPATAKK